MSKPKSKYRAFKPVTMTDGILAWPQDRFDNTVGEWTDGDIDKFQASLGASAPLERIASMRERLDSLKDVTPMIKMHADAIRAIHAGLDNHHSVTKAELGMLAEADRLWEKIIILRDLMPKATMGAKHSKGQSEKAKLPRGIIAEIKKNLVSQYPDYKAKELWPHLYAALESMELDPKENDDTPGKEWYTYDHNDSRKRIKFTTFENIKINE